MTSDESVSRQMDLYVMQYARVSNIYICREALALEVATMYMFSKVTLATKY